jgi:hypothetical protein
MKKMHFVLISVVLGVFLVLSCGQTDGANLDEKLVINPIGITKGGDQGENDDDQGGKKKPQDEIEIPNDDPSIIYLNKDWNKNENSIPFHLPNGQPNRGFPDRYEFFESENGLYPNYKVSSFWVITSVDGIKTAMDELNNDFSYYRQYYFEKFRDEYKESYFMENVLILWSITEPSGSIQNLIDSLDVNGDTLTINTLRFYPSGQTCDMQYRLCEIQVKKADIAGVTNFEIARKNVRHVPETIIAWISDGYFGKEFTVEDFSWDNVVGIRNDVLSSIKMHLVILYLKYPGTKHAKAALEHFETLDFVKGGWWE